VNPIIALRADRNARLHLLHLTPAMEMLWQDIRFAVRTLLKNPTFTIAAVLTLGLGIGINTTIFSVVNAILIRPMPHVDTERLTLLQQWNVKLSEETSFSYPDFADLREQSRSFESMAAYYDRQIILAGPGGEPEQLEVEMVTPNLFGMLGARPALGRLFLPEEGTEGRGDVVLLANSLWEERYGADPGVVGSTVTIDGTPHTVVGVMPPRFGFPDNQPMWIPFAQTPNPETRGARYMRVVGRLVPGVSMEAAQAETDAISQRLAERHPQTNAGIQARVRDFNEAWAGEMRAILLVMLGAVGFVLLIACSNVANLMLSRAAARQKEIAVRAALGAGRGRLLRQLLTESLVVALLGAALGVLIAHQALNVILASFPFTLPLWMSFDIDRNVLLYTVALAVGTGIVFGLLPALRATRTDLNSTLRDGGRGVSGGRTRGRLRSGLIVGQLALATVLLAGALLMIRSFFQLQFADPGFDTQAVLSARVVTGGERYEGAGGRNAFFQQIVERAETLPGVSGVALTSIVPLADASTSSTMRVPDRPVEPGEEAVVQYRGITADYFGVLGVPMLRGRAPTRAEVESGAPVVVVNRTLAERTWPGEDAVGRIINVGGPDVTVIGVARDLRLRSLDEKPGFQVYAPYTHRTPRSMAVLLRAEGDPASHTAALRTLVRDLDPGVPFAQSLVLREVVQRSLWRQRLFGGLFASFAVIALVLAVTGVYGVIAYSVSQRTQEMGVRLALGAGTRRVLRMVTGEGLRLAAVGVGIGMLASLALMRLLASQLYGVTATDPVTLGATAAVLVGAAMAASYLPARRATQIDPVVALRQE
jgi:putative ABC transport system permease protein